MYLKALEIIGFKSFADKARFDLQRGMTGIVGPNGCGKSNVVDSIRWCIGEMSWKSLRTGSMMGILFDGSQKRPAMNMAEVTMVFDNESRRLPIDFTEVTVTRRLFRSGESEYYLNRVQCRLRDIKDLFMDTGIGGEGYAIIDQGGVEFVLSAKPEQRRELFEEAAGVSKYKSKRDEALRKLERVDSDLARLMDSVVLIEEQIKKLDAEARKARTYQKYREELKSSELALAVHEIAQHQAEADTASAELEPVKRDLFDKNTQISAAEGELAALNLTLAEQQTAAARQSEEIASATHRVGTLEGEIKRCADLAEELRRQIRVSEDDDASGARRLAELEPALERMAAQIAEMAAALAPVQAQYQEKHAQLQSAEGLLSELASQQDARNSELMRLTQAEIEASSKTASLSSGIAHDENDLASTARELERAEQELAQKQARAGELKTALEQQSAALEAARQALSGLEKTRAELSAQKDSLNAALLNARSAGAAANAKLEMARAQGGKDPYWVGAQAVLSAQLPGVGATLRSKLSLSDADRVYAEEALGKFMDSVLCDNRAAAESAAALVKNAGRARCRFIVLDEVPQAAQAAQAGNLKARISYPPELEPLMSAVLGDYSVEDTRLRGSWWLTGGSGDAPSTEPYWAQEKDAQAELEKARAEISGLEDRLAQCAGDLSKNEGDLSLARETAQAESLKENSLGNELNSCESARLSAQEMVSLIRQEREKLSAQKDEKARALESAKAELEGHKQARAETTRTLEELAAQKAAKQSQAAELKESESQIQVSLNDLRMKQVERESDRRNLISERDGLNAAAARRKEQREDFSRRALEHEENRLAAQSQLEQQRQALAELERADKALREEMSSLKADYDRRSAELNAVKAELGRLQLREHDLEAVIKNHTAVKEDAVRRLQEEWQTTYEEAREKYADAPVDLERVKMLRRRIENMGAINMTAPEEYDALSARDQFLKSQINDLNQAKADLKSAINRINATTRENFRHIFQQVREHFQRIYQTLFVGGEANLILTQPDNLLETGVEIMAQPPGKKLQNIAALSGGEKALTALALLFSFFCVNPSPFCVMDEADAPLDEANVERFVNLLREFSSQTQFLVVTHNKRTMEAADVLYGVTMEESGVSKIISVGLNQKKN